MRFLADENFSAATVEMLRGAGLHVEWIPEFAPGMEDAAVLAHAVATDAILLTHDRDFGDLVYKRAAAIPPGVIYFRLGPVRPDIPARALLNLLALPEFQPIGCFTVVAADRVRQRPLLRPE